MNLLYKIIQTAAAMWLEAMLLPLSCSASCPKCRQEKLPAFYLRLQHYVA